MPRLVSVTLDQGGDSRRLLQVEFTSAPDGTFLPSLLWEWNAGAAAALANSWSRTSSGLGQFDLEGLARYSNFRRFGVSTSEEPRPR